MNDTNFSTRTLPRLHRPSVLALGLRALGLGALGLGASVGCDVRPVEGGEGSQIPPAVQAAFNSGCATSSACHRGSSPAGGLSLETGASDSIIEGKTPNSGLPLVRIGDLYGSYMALKLLPPSARPAGVAVAGEQMPDGISRPTEVSTILAWIAGQDLDGVEPVSPGPTCFGTGKTTPPASFETDVYPILQSACIIEGCHLGPTSSDLELPEDDAAAAYALLVDVQNPDSGMAYVTPTMPDQSYLWHKLAGTHLSIPEDSAMGLKGTGRRMPIGGALCPDDLQGIYAWIYLGAEP